ncbi:hypothetical protein G7Y79_00029g063370 [Physcia stellaris]|nr:hypothetical protein G7Y79_00029g063370 [Physcia stellaris]
MDRQNDSHLASTRDEKKSCGRDSPEDTRVPNSPDKVALKDTCTTPTNRSPQGSMTLNDLEIGQSANVSQRTSKSRIRRHFQDDVSKDWTDVLLLLCWFTTGFLDSTIFKAYGTFVSMQTGNTVLIGLGASNARSNEQPYRWAKSLTSLICFVTGCLFFSRCSRALGELRRSTLMISFLFQSLILLIAATVVQIGLVQGRLDRIINDIVWLQEIPIALLSFQAPGGTCGSRQLGFFETPTVVVTTMIYDFASDPKLFAPLRENPPRNRRFGGFVGMLVGAIAGGWVTTAMGHIHVTLWVAAAIKASIGLAWVVWPKKERTKQWGH